MAETAMNPGTTTESFAANGSAQRHAWTLFVACAGVALVLASVVALNTALLACLLLPAGAVGDRYGRRAALLVGLGIFAVASLCPLFFDSPLHIIVARAVAGAGAAFVMPATLKASKIVFVDGINSSYLVMAAIAAVAAIVIALFAPGRDGRRLRADRRLLRDRRRVDQQVGPPRVAEQYGYRVNGS